MALKWLVSDSNGFEVALLWLSNGVLMGSRIWDPGPWIQEPGSWTQDHRILHPESRILDPVS